MNHGGMAFITENRIHLSEDLLMPLSLTEGSPLNGLYYPTPAGYENVQRHPDLVLTPIPTWAWPRSAGLRLELKHQAGALSHAVGFLKNENLNILMSECTRAGHRYSTCNLVVEFEDLKGVPAGELANVVPERVEALKRKILSGCSEVLQPRDSPELRDPVGAWALRCLNHFYQHLEEHEGHHFSARCLAGDVVDIEDAINVRDWFELREGLPTIGFASLDTENFTIRVVVLTKRELENFRLVTLRYSQRRRANPGISSRGLLHSVTNTLRENWNIWHMYGECRQHLLDMEEYGFHIVVESLSEPWDEAKINSALTAALKIHPNVYLEEIKVAPISPLRIFVSIRNQKAFRRRDTVEKYCRSAATKYGILPTNLVFIEDHTSVSTTEKVTDEIHKCHGMLQFFMGSPDNPLMDWLNAEFFLASDLRIPRIRIIDETLEGKVTFERDRSHLSFSLDSADQHIEAVIQKAFEELVKEMRAHYR
jgi:hypothetical protein